MIQLNEQVVQNLLHAHKGFKIAYDRLCKWRADLTVRANGKDIGIAYETASQLRRKYKLRATPGRKDQGKRGRANQPLDAKLCGLLRVKGFTFDAIGALYGVTRQHIEGTLRRKGDLGE